MPFLYSYTNKVADSRSICFDLPDRHYRERYIIRGGSRKMKSEFLRKAADAFPESIKIISPPWQITAVSIGDVLITLPTGMIDVKPTDTDLSLTDILPRKMLTMLGGEIVSKSDEKKDLEKTNSLLSDIFFCLESSAARLMSETFLSEKAEKFANRFAAAMQAPIGGGHIKYRTSYARCAGGIVCSGEYTNRAMRIYAVSDKYGVGDLLLAAMKKAFVSRGVDLICCSDQSGRHLGIYIESAAIFIGRVNSAVEVNKVINTDRFVSDIAVQNKHFIKKMLRAREEIGAFYEENNARIEKIECKLDTIFDGILDRSAFDALCDRVTKEISSSNTGECDK